MDKDFQAHLKYKKQIAKMSASTNGRMKRSTMRPVGYVDGGSDRELSIQPMTADAIIVE